MQWEWKTVVQTNCKAVVSVKFQSKNRVGRSLRDKGKKKKMQSTVTNAISTGSFMRTYCPEVKNHWL